MSSKLCVVCHQHGARPLRRDEYPFEIFRIALDFDLQLNAQISCRSLRFLYILRCVRTGLANQKHNLSKLWKQLSDHLQSLCYNVGANAGHSGDVVVGPGETRDEPCRDPSSSQGRLLSTLLAANAEFERDLIRERTGEGRKRAMAKGIKFGRKPKFSDYQRQEALKRRAAGETLAEIAKSYTVDLSMNWPGQR